MAGGTHPVTEVLRARRAAGSVPGDRDDPYRVALVVEGGGMRGVVTAGMTAALERLGLAQAFDLVVGSSAGAMNGAALIAGVARDGAAMYSGPLASRRFVNPARLLLGRPALDLGVLLAEVTATFDPRHHARTLDGPVELRCVAVDVDTAEPVTLSGMRTEEELRTALLATIRMPWVGGDPVEIDGRRLIDGALAAPIPLDAALAAGATHALVLQSRPYGVPRSTGSRLAEVLIERHLHRMNPRLAQLWRDRAAAYEALVGDIARRSRSPDGDAPYVLGVRPRAGTPVVGQLERRAEVLAAAAETGGRLVVQVLGDEDPANAPLEAAG